MESFLQLEECLNGNKENLKAQITEDIIINQGRQNIKQQVKPRLQWTIYLSLSK
jgi:hypothetical protein